ncbi:MAG TPA: hypothetical protein VGI78_12060 [Acetobacteraceae bacterium]
MQCLVQVFDSNGNPQLHGGSRLKDHIDWLLLLGLNNGAAVSQKYNAGSSRSLPSQDIQLVLRADDPVMPTLYSVASGQYTADSWSKATLDCFTDDDQSWSLRMTLQGPTVTGIQSLGGAFAAPNAPLLAVGLNFASSSIDYRDPDAKVGYFMPSGAIWDPDQQVCKVFDPNDAVSHLPESTP